MIDQQFDLTPQIDIPSNTKMGSRKYITREGSLMARKELTPDLVKKKLHIDSFRELSGDKVVALLNQMGGMNPELRMKIVEQFPSFKDFANRSITALENSHERVVQANEKEQEKAHDAWGDLRGILAAELQKDDVDEDYRKYIIEKLVESAQHQEAIASRNQDFLAGALKLAASAVMAVGAVAAYALLAGGEGDSNST